MAAPVPADGIGNGNGQYRFVIGVDFGTTYTGVSWVLDTGSPIATNHIKPVKNWPGAGGNEIDTKVPSVYTYSASEGGSWGCSIKDNEHVINWTKLQLRPPTKESALSVLLANLKDIRELDRFRFQSSGLPPTHLIKQPVDVLHDFMIEVADCVQKAIIFDKSESLLAEYPVDLVITHPAQWPLVAINRTMRAITDAFVYTFSDTTFRHVMLATEPEACAQMTMRDAVEKKMTRLSKGDCVLIVDAGGGTVDVVACRVQSVEPFRIVPITRPTCGNYGSTCVEQAFLNKFLPYRLGAHYNRFTQGGHGQGSHVVLKGPILRLNQDFINNIKHRFEGPPETGEPLPEYYLPLNFDIPDNPAMGIDNANLRITCENLVDMFRDSVDGTLKLIQEQLTKIDLRNERGRVRDIFLSGGFSANEYLFRQVKKSTAGRNINVVRASESLTAVSKGAVLLGLGLGCDMPPLAVRCPVHIGVVLSKPYDKFNDDPSQLYVDSLQVEVPGGRLVERAKNHIHWVITKGDLIDPAKGIQRTVSIIRRITTEGNKAGQIYVVTSFEDNMSRLPTKWTGDGDSDGPVSTLQYDLNNAFKRFQTDPYFSQVSPDRVKYASPELALQIAVNQREAVARLVIDSRQETLRGANVWALEELDRKSIDLFE